MGAVLCRKGWGVKTWSGNGNNLVWTFIHGAYSGFYPYSFLNVGELGLTRVLLNEAGLLVIFLILELALVTGAD